MAVALGDLLEENRVQLELASSTRADALREIVARLRGPAVDDSDKLLREVLAREELHTTYMGRGVAFPHARTDLVQSIVLGIGRSRAGVVFGDNGETAHLIFLIGVPRRMVKDYLVCVGALARITSDEKTRAALMDAASAAEFVELLRSASLVLE